MLGYFDGWGRCPACRRSRPSLQGIVYMILLVAVAMAVGTDIEPGARLAACLAIYPLTFVNVVMHEATHALVARLLGWRVHIIAIGTRGPWIRMRLGGTLLVLNGGPLGGGHCSAFPEVGALSRRAIALYVGAPMAVHAVAAAAALRCVSRDSLGGVLAAMFAASNLFIIVWNTWPRDLPHRGPAVATDGKVFLDLWRAPERELAQWRLAAGLGAFQAHLVEGKPEEAFKAAEQALLLDPTSDVAAMCLAIAARATGRHEQALPHAAAYAKAAEAGYPSKLRKLPDRALAAEGLFRGRELEEYMRASFLVGLDRLDEVLAISERGAEAAMSEESRALWQGCVALALLMIGRDLDRAEGAARYAYERLPWVPFVEAAWGMVRIERGSPAEGLEVFACVKRIDRQGSTAWLRAAWTVVARAALGKREVDLPEVLRAPGAWPACRRRAERALASG